jgi:hypothetical protein
VISTSALNSSQRDRQAARCGRRRAAVVMVGRCVRIHHLILCRPLKVTICHKEWFPWRFRAVDVPEESTLVGLSGR